MSYTVELTQEALLDLKCLRKREQAIIVAAIESQLVSEPLRATRNRKPLHSADLASWEVRVGKYRVFYDVQAGTPTVIVKAIGWKQHNRLFIRGREFTL